MTTSLASTLFLTIDMAAAEVGKTRRTICYHIDNARLRTEKLGKQKLIRREDWENFKRIWNWRDSNGK